MAVMAHIHKTFAFYLIILAARFFSVSTAICLALQQSLGAQDVTIRTTTRMVELTLIATDSKGRPIEDLSQGDIELFDAGKPENISLFAVESRVRRGEQTRPQEQGVFSNRRDDFSGSNTSINIILIDILNTRFGDQVHAKAQIIKFLQQLHTEDRVALYVLKDDIQVLHDFTRNARPLIEALNRFRGGVFPALDASDPLSAAGGGAGLVDNLQSLLGRSETHQLEFFTRSRVEKTLRGLETIALHTARFAGRKNLLWVSGGFPFWIGLSDGTQAFLSHDRLFANFSSEIRRTTNMLCDANIAIYPIDAKGLGASEPPPPQFLYSRGSRNSQVSVQVFDRDRESLPSNRESMLQLATGTGGRAFYNTNDIMGAVRRAVEDTRVTYLVGFYPTHGNWNGKFREIKLKAKRQGMRLRYRRGYYAMPDRVPDDNLRRSIVQAAILSPLDATAIGIEVKVQEDPESGFSSLIINIDPRNITFEQQNDLRSGKIDVVVAGPTPEGTVASGEVATYQLDLKRETYEKVYQQGLLITRKVSITPNVDHLRVVVYDWPSGAAGSVTIPVTQAGLDHAAP